MINNKVVFCNDGVLRSKHEIKNESFAFPIVTMAATKNDNNPFYFLKFWNDPVAVEENTLVSDIFFALEPWSDLIQNYTGINLAAYIAEMRKPALFEHKEPAWVNIYRNTIYMSETASTPKNEDETFSAYMQRRMNEPKKYTNGFFSNVNLEAYMFKMSEDGKEKRFALPDIQEAKNLPVYISNKNIVHGSYKRSNMFADFDAITHFGSDYGGRGIVVDETITLREFIEGFLRGFFAETPEQSRENERIVDERVKAHKKEKKNKLHNVTEEVVEHESANGNQKPYSVEYSNGFMSDLANSLMYEINQSEKIKQDCFAIEGNYPPIRIKEIVEGTPAETFIFGVDINKKEIINE